MRYLAVYNLRAVWAAPALRAFAGNQRWQRVLIGDWRIFWLLIAGTIVYPLAWPVIARVAPQLFSHTLFGLVDLMDLFVYMPFFACGLLLQACPQLFRRFLDHDAALWVLHATGGGAMLLLGVRGLSMH